MNEDDRGITPPGVTAITVESRSPGWLVTIEQGNGDVIKTLDLTELERLQLAAMLGFEPGTVRIGSLEFVDVSRRMEDG